MAAVMFSRLSMAQQLPVLSVSAELTLPASTLTRKHTLTQKRTKGDIHEARSGWVELISLVFVYALLDRSV